MKRSKLTPPPAFDETAVVEADEHIVSELCLSPREQALQLKNDGCNCAENGAFAEALNFWHRGMKNFLFKTTLKDIMM